MSTSHSLPETEEDLTGVDTPDDAAQLCSLLASWTHENRHIDPTYVTDIAACTKLLQDAPPFHAAVRTALITKDYQVVRNSPLLLRPNRQQTMNLLQKIRPHVKVYLDGTPSFPAWDPKPSVDDEDLRSHLTGLSLLKAKEGPSLLLDRLGTFCDDPILRERVRLIFMRGRDTFLVNASGSGKTRLAFEGLCQDWGFYFSASDDNSGYAALELTDILESQLDRHAGFTPELPSPTSVGFATQLEANQQIAAKYFNAALLARLMIFQIFAEFIHETSPTPEHKLRWLLFQLRPRIPPIPDCIARLTDLLIKDDDSYTKGNIVETMAKLRDGFGGEIHLFYVLDEAQAAATAFPSAFSTDGQPHSILPEIIRTWQTHTLEKFDVSLVISGTHIPPDIFQCGANSSSRHRWVSNTGAFDESAQRRYIEYFLPPVIGESQTADRLMSRAWNWMRGRHRFTSTLVMMLLLNGFLPSDPILDDCFNTFTHIPPSDSDTDMYSISSILKTVAEKKFHILKFATLATHLFMKKTVRQVLFHYLVTNQHPKPFGVDAIEIVAEGFGRFADAERKEVCLDEPLVLVGAANWLLGCSTLGDHPSPTYYSILQRDPPSDNEMLAKCVAYYLTLALGKKRRLCDLFAFPGSCPKWAKQNATLVALHSTPTGLDVSEDFSTLATVTDCMTETVSWMKHEDPTPFCISTNPDLILSFILRLEDGKFIWVFLRPAVSEETYLKKTDLESMLVGLQDANLFADETDDQLRDNAKDALKALPDMTSHLGPFGVLRVVASFPGHPRMGRLPLKTTRHAASLNMGLFRRIHEKIPATDMVNAMASSVAGLPRVSKRKDDFDDGEHRKKRRRSPVPAPESNRVGTRSRTINL